MGKVNEELVQIAERLQQIVEHQQDEVEQLRRETATLRLRLSEAEGDAQKWRAREARAGERRACFYIAPPKKKGDEEA